MHRRPEDRGWRDVWLVGTGIVLGWLMSKASGDPHWRLGSPIVLSAAAAMTLVLALAVVATGKDRMIRTAMKITTPPTNYDRRPRPNLS
jgi:hypothetical protein